MQGLYTRKKRVRYLPNVEALRKPRWMISDVHAISANTHNYRNSSWSKKFLRFLHSPNNCSCRYCLPTKIASPPCTQRICLSIHRLRRVGDTWLQNYKIISEYHWIRLRFKLFLTLCIAEESSLLLKENGTVRERTWLTKKRQALQKGERSLQTGSRSCVA